MDFSFTDEQTLLKDSLQRFLREKYQFEKRREIVASGGFDRDMWREFAELGILGATLPEAAGGSGGGAVEAMIILEALGEALVVEPYLESVILGGRILSDAAGPVAAELLADVITGEAVVTYAGTEAAARFAPHHVRTSASPVDGGFLLTGAKSVIHAAPAASHIIVPARLSGAALDRSGIALFLIERSAPATRWHDYRLIDGRSASDLYLDETRVSSDAMIVGENDGIALIEKALDEAAAALCAEAVGVMRRMLDDTIAYTKQRQQFGQPLSSFQVLQHRMVNMYMELERSISAVYLATLRLDTPAPERARAVSAAKVTVSKAARKIGQDAVQLHGAMGLTDELAVGHYFKRATIIESLFGSADYHLGRYTEFAPVTPAV